VVLLEGREAVLASSEDDIERVGDRVMEGDGDSDPVEGVGEVTEDKA